MKREFKISVVSELESGKPLAQIAVEHDIHSSLPCRWQDELAENPERANSFNGDRCKYEAQDRPSFGGWQGRLMPRMSLADQRGSPNLR